MTSPATRRRLRELDRLIDRIRWQRVLSHRYGPDRVASKAAATDRDPTRRVRFIPSHRAHEHVG